MSTIPISEVVNADILISAASLQAQGFGIANIITNQTGVIGIAERVREYTGSTSVATDFGANSEVAKAATTYFSQQPQPANLKVSVRFETAQPAQLRGGASSTLTDFTSIGDGSFSVTMTEASGTETVGDITGLDFTSATTLAGVATVIQSGLQSVATGGFTSATCTHDGTRFFIETGDTGTGVKISYLSTATAGTYIGSTLQMSDATEGVNGDGIDAETIAQSLVNISNKDNDFYGFGFTREVRDSSDVIDAASFAVANKKKFATVTNDVDSYDSGTTNDILSQLRDGSYKTLAAYSSYPTEYVDFAALGRLLTTNFDSVDSAMTLNTKDLAGVTVEKLNSSQRSVLNSKNGNAVYNFGGAARYSSGILSDGTFADEKHNLDWFEAEIETVMFNYLSNATTKRPYTSKGIAGGIAQLASVCERAFTSGILGAGEFSTQNNEKIQLERGYQVNALSVTSVSQADKDARIYRGYTIYVLLAGAIHSLKSITINVQR